MVQVCSSPGGEARDSGAALADGASSATGVIAMAPSASESAPSGMGLVLGDGGLEALEVFPLLLHLLFHPLPGRCAGLVFVTPLEVLQLTSELSLEPLNMVQ